LSAEQDVRAAVSKDKEAVKLSFRFFPNPFFSNATLEREDYIETVELGGKDLRVSAARATSIEWLQPPDGSRARKGKKAKAGAGKKGGNKGKGKGGGGAVDEDEDEAGGDGGGGGGVATQTVKLEYKTSVFALFNPPNLSDLAGNSEGKAAGGKGKAAQVLPSDPRLGKLTAAIMQDREVHKSLWLDVVPRATLHFVACVDPPTYSCPMGLGLPSADEAAVEEALKVQEELDHKRASYAEKLRAIRLDFAVKRDQLAKQRSAVVAPMVGEGLPLFWLVTLRNTPQVWEAFTDRDELALKHLTDMHWTYVDKRAGQAEPQDCDFLKENTRRSFRLEMRFRQVARRDGGKPALRLPGVCCRVWVSREMRRRWWASR
jgi:hypothetical protein